MLREYSLSIVALLKGIVYTQQKEVWENLLQYEPDIKKYVAAMGLELYLDTSEGYAYLRQHEALEDELQIPRLAEKRQLNFYTSLLLLVLRKYLLERDAQGGALRPIITREELINRARIFLPTSPDEAKQHDKIFSTINKVVELGFIRRLEEDGQNYEIHRILKGFVNADVVDDMLKKLQQFATERKTIESTE
jgi:hypothetical protein